MRQHLTITILSSFSPNHGGAWSTDGCTLETSTKEYTECSCDHLANFAVLMDVVDADSMQVQYMAN